MLFSERVRIDAKQSFSREQYNLPANSGPMSLARRVFTATRLASLANATKAAQVFVCNAKSPYPIPLFVQECLWRHLQKRGESFFYSNRLFKMRFFPTARSLAAIFRKPRKGLLLPFRNCLKCLPNKLFAIVFDFTEQARRNTDCR